MSGRQRITSDAVARGQGLARKIGQEIREARLAAGLSQADVARASTGSQSRISRLERCAGRPPTVVELSVVASVVGLKLVVQSFPVLDRLRDGPQIRLLGAMGARLPRGVPWRTEVPMPGRGDLRALDGLIALPGCRVAVEAWTRLSDAQAQIRAAELKRRDVGAERLVILLADTPHNRAAVEASEPVLRTSFPLRTREIMSALSHGRDPGGDGIAFLTLVSRRSQPKPSGGNEQRG
jgi:transcriptional regulator with XRE-family HTH domain